MINRKLPAIHIYIHTSLTSTDIVTVYQKKNTGVCALDFVLISISSFFITFFSFSLASYYHCSISLCHHYFISHNLVVVLYMGRDRRLGLEQPGLLAARLPAAAQGALKPAFPAREGRQPQARDRVHGVLGQADVVNARHMLR